MKYSYFEKNMDKLDFWRGGDEGMSAAVKGRARETTHYYKFDEI